MIDIIIKNLLTHQSHSKIKHTYNIIITSF